MAEQTFAAFNASRADAGALVNTDSLTVVRSGVTYKSALSSLATWAATALAATALQVGSIELGHASDTSITRVSAGVAAIEGSNILTAAAIGVSVQAYDADLAAWAGVNPSSYSTTAQIAAAYQPLAANLTAINQSLATTSSPTFAGLTLNGAFPQLTLQDNATNNTAKYSLILGTQYGNTAEPEGFGIIGGGSDATNNIVYIGGNYSAHNAATELRFFAAANSSTRLGTLQLLITSAAATFTNTPLVGSDPVMTRGATETIAGPKTFSARLTNAGQGTTNTSGAMATWLTRSSGQTTGIVIRGLSVADTLIYAPVGSDDFAIGFDTGAGAVAGTQVLFYQAGGTVFGTATGGAKGAGTINAVGVYDDNTLLTDLVLDLYVAGTFDKKKYATHPIAAEVAPWWFDPDSYSAFWKEARHLPGMVQWSDPSGQPSTGALVTRLTAVAETHAVLLANDNDRIKALQARVDELEEKLAA